MSDLPALIRMPEDVDEPITVRNQPWVKALLVAGVPSFAGIGGYLCWLAWETGFNASLDDVLLSAMGAFSLVLVAKGLPLLRFLHHTATLDGDGLKIARGNEASQLGWEQIGAVSFSDTFHVLSVHDRAGRLVYAVDYYAENFPDFARRLIELRGA